MNYRRYFGDCYEQDNAGSPVINKMTTLQAIRQFFVKVFKAVFIRKKDCCK